jgi:hypothetical protein
MKKIKVAFIYHKDNIFLSGNHFDNTYYHFYINALKRNETLDVTYVPTGDIFDASGLKDKFDIILLWENSEFGMPNELVGLDELNLPVITKVSDPFRASKSIKLHKKWKIDHYFWMCHEDFFYELYPRKFKYKTIIFGLESSLYQNVKPFNERIKNKILLTGSIGNTKFFSRMINDIRRPKWNAYRFYYLRTLCSKLPYVSYSPTLSHKYVNDMYPKLLEQYSASITASSYSPNIKYLENTAAGCLTFMEITKKNRGDYFGYKDEETAIFIDENNYREKFNEFLSDPDNPKWERIANAGREFALKNLNNDKAVSSLVELMDSMT